MQSTATTALAVALVVLATGVSLWAAGRIRAGASRRAIDGGRGKKETSDAEGDAPVADGSQPGAAPVPPTLPRERRSQAQLEHNVELLRTLLHQYIVEREAAEDTLRESEQRYRLLFDAAPRPIWVYDRESLRFLAVNESAVRQYGWSREEFLAMAVTDLYPEEERAGVRAGIVRAGELERERRTRHRLRSGESREVLLVSHALPFAGRPARLVLVDDVTDRMRHDELLRRSERMASLGHTLAGVAHELNNPLAAIIGFAQLLLRDARTPDERSALETIHHEAARAGRIVKDLLAFARRQDARPWAPVDLNAVVRHITDSQRYAIETRGIRRVVELAPALPRIMGDASQLEQVVLNLVVNARQALEGMLEASPTRSAPRLTVRTRAENGRVLLEVADEGPGIPASQRERIWDPFWTTKGEGEGTGLGLSVVHGIVTAHGGTIAVGSEPGEGTRFVVSLPLLDEALNEEADSAPERPLDVLVVDDDADTLALASASLGERGHAVLTADSAAQALRLAEHTAFDVVVCGLAPAAGGVEAVHQLRKLPTLRRSRFVIAGDASNGDGALALPKPFEIAALRRAVEGT